MIYNAIDIARYVINFSNKNGKSITNLKLQKLLYYIQAGFLVEIGHCCFNDEILCWQHGPVVKNVYDSYKQFKDHVIPEQKDFSKITIKDGKLVIAKEIYDESNYDECDKKLINKIILGLINYDPWELVDRTHEESPWYDLQEFNEIITRESIKKYFMLPRNRDRIYGKFN